eukprot:COSAG02_NODE_63_length_43286_cov_54.666412_15_plen_223_part_00
MKEPKGPGFLAPTRTHTRPAKLTQAETGRSDGEKSQVDGGGNSRQSSSSSGVATRRKSQKNAASDKTRFAPRLIHAPHHAQPSPRSPPTPQHCWLRCWRTSGGSAPTPAAARACAAAASSPPSTHGFSSRHSRSWSISLRMTGKMTGKCRTAGDSAKSFQPPASGSGVHTVPSSLIGSSLVIHSVHTVEPYCTGVYMYTHGRNSYTPSSDISGGSFRPFQLP